MLNLDSQQKIDEFFMRKALRLAESAAECGEVPVGAVIVHNGQVIARSGNQVEMLKDATAHAEVLVITQASAALSNWRLSECTLYVTKEPCAMCAGAIVNSKLGRLVYGCSDPRSGAAGGTELNVVKFPGMLWQPEVESGILEYECLEIIQYFFKMRRQQSKNEQIDIKE